MKKSLSVPLLIACCFLLLSSCNKIQKQLLKITPPTNKKPLPIIPNGVYKFQNATNYTAGIDQAVDIVAGTLADGAGAWQDAYALGNSQRWQITSIGNGYYSIINVNSGKALTAIVAAQLVQNPYTGADNQLWNITAGGLGTFIITNKCDSYKVTLDGNSTVNDTKVTQLPAVSPGQNWYLFDLDTTFFNPLKPGGADPWVIKQGGYYYYMETTGFDLTIRKTAKMSGLHTVAVNVIWIPPAGTAYSKDIWAPELHYLDNKWYVYFGADDGNDANHRIYVLENTSADPTTGTWTFKGKIGDTSNIWAIDPTILQIGANRYILWSGWKTANPSNSGIQQIYIAKMLNAWTITGPRVMISQPTYSWETNGLVNEGPEILTNASGNIFCIYSGSGCWTDDYKLGQLALTPGADPMVAASWTKKSTPVFQKSIANSVYAPGHCSFFKSVDGTQDWILYHANSASGQGCGISRSPRIQQFTWNTDGTPNFGIPTATITVLNKPAGE